MKQQDQEMEALEQPIKPEDVDAGAVSNSNLSVAQAAHDFFIENYAGGLWDLCQILHFEQGHPWAVERVDTGGSLLSMGARLVTLCFPCMKPHELARINYGDDFRNFWFLETLAQQFKDDFRRALYDKLVGMVSDLDEHTGRVTTTLLN